ncbi:DUF3502 domain-containing protein [Neobacillus sp. MER 74]|nr:DUF3502 domain-containing protein [Neobacillus sp. MER 74]MCM3117516.1 DUF3502 domain-containing protein [Neobacillus sp. MER 74]
MTLKISGLNSKSLTNLLKQHHGFHFNSDPVRSELASITNISKEFYPALATGSVDPEEYLPKYNKKLKEAGIDKVLKEIQKQFDDWKSKQK